MNKLNQTGSAIFCFCLICSLCPKDSFFRLFWQKNVQTNKNCNGNIYLLGTAKSKHIRGRVDWQKLGLRYFKTEGLLACTANGSFFTSKNDKTLTISLDIYIKFSTKLHRQSPVFRWGLMMIMHLLCRIISVFHSLRKVVWVKPSLCYLSSKFIF